MERFAEQNFHSIRGFLRVPREFSVNKHWWTRHRKSISAQNFMGLKTAKFSPANLSTFTVLAIGIPRSHNPIHYSAYGLH